MRVNKLDLTGAQFAAQGQHCGKNCPYPARHFPTVTGDLVQRQMNPFGWKPIAIISDKRNFVASPPQILCQIKNVALNPAGQEIGADFHDPHFFGTVSHPGFPERSDGHLP